MLPTSSVQSRVGAGIFFEILPGLLIAAILFSPFLILLTHISGWSLPPTSEIAGVFALTTLQAGASAFASLIFGALAAAGLFWLETKAGRRASLWGEGLTLLPNAVPVLLLLLSVMKAVPSARGPWGIVLVHSLLNSGLVAVAIIGVVRAKVSGMVELAWIEGASRLRFLVKVLLPFLARDLAMITFFVFALCFTSFAVPLVIGGSSASTVEVLIYQKVRIGTDWSQALGLSVLQTSVILMIAVGLNWLPKQSTSQNWASGLSARRARSESWAALPLLQWRWGLGLAFAPALLLLFGLFSDLAIGMRKLAALTPLLQELPRLIATSLLVSVSTGLLSVAVLLALAYVRPRGVVRRLLSGYTAPSLVLVGFALLIAIPETPDAHLETRSVLRLVLGLALVTLPSFFRWQWDALVNALDGQRIIAATLGASKSQVFWRVIYPQLVSPAFRVGGLAALWAWGDFALSSVVTSRMLTSAMAAHSLMSSYRLDAATALVWILVAGGLITFALFVGVGHVLGAKPQT